MQKPLGAILVALTACSGPQAIADAGFDAGTDAGSGPADAGPPAPIAIMGLFATETDAGTRLQAFIEVNRGVAHEFDDGVCTADRVRPRDGDAAWLRISGYTAPGQPILCTDEDAGYVCRFPSGVDVTAPASVEFGAPLDPIGAGPVAFATGGGASVGAAFVRVPRAAGRLTVQEDLSGLPATLHVDCSGCDGGHVFVKVRRGPAAIDCDFALAPTVRVPAAALGLLPSSGAASYTVALGAAARADDLRGGSLVGQLGVGVYGAAP